MMYLEFGSKHDAIGHMEGFDVDELDPMSFLRNKFPHVFQALDTFLEENRGPEICDSRTLTLITTIFVYYSGKQTDKVVKGPRKISKGFNAEINLWRQDMFDGSVQRHSQEILSVLNKQHADNISRVKARIETL
ncbi:hypothetical protein GGR95_001866 [Sulfitobacter undariae]|uniref:Uncharacterized protein n=1 Tax=Sulfitobacter undariae TaxID=1563671 RepID=A0A7W6E3X1_9RHOB|nr:hypothetical protein [Sulfitobacter undariae]MBB3994225.1 hypothetical protein [Sulfitobacter undariae]